MSTILPSGLIVSCQAEGDSPFATPDHIAAFARAAEMGGAVAVRIRDAENITRVRSAITLPIIGLTKSAYPSGEVLITPHETDITALHSAGADVVALDATERKRPDGRTGIQVLADAATLGVPLMADISSEAEAIAAAAAGAAYVATTLSGYVDSKRRVRLDVPDLELLEMLRGKLSVPLVAEGRFWTPEQTALAIRLGAHAVVVGTAITRPVDIVKRFVSALSPKS